MNVQTENIENTTKKLAIEIKTKNTMPNVY